MNELIDLRSILRWFSEEGVPHIEIRDALSDHHYYEGICSLAFILKLDYIGILSYPLVCIDFVPIGKNFPIIYIIEDLEEIKL